MTAIVINVLNVTPGSLLMAPVGITTRHDSVDSASVTGARIVNVLMEPELGLGALLLEAEGESVQLIHRVSPASSIAVYP